MANKYHKYLQPKNEYNNTKLSQQLSAYQTVFLLLYYSTQTNQISYDDDVKRPIYSNT